MAKKIDREFLVREIARLDPALKPEDDAWKASMAMLAALVVGPNIKRVSAFTRVPRSKVAEFSARLRAAEIWKGGQTQADWLDKADGTIAFFCDVNVALGLMNRVAAV